MQKKKNQNAKKPKNALKNQKKLLEALVMTAIFTAMAVALKSVTKITVPLLGAGGMSVSFAGIFSFFPAILYGPLYGGASSALCDFLGWLMKPDGPYNPLFTVVAFLGGCIKGLVWMGLSKGAINKTAMKSVLAGIFALVLVLGCVFTVSLNADGVISGLYAVKEELPMKDKILETELSPISEFATSLAKYNNDSVTVTSIQPNEEGIVLVPKYLNAGKASLEIKKVSAEIFNTPGLKAVLLPSDNMTVDEPSGFELTNKNIVIHSKLPSEKTKAFAEKHGIRIDTENADFNHAGTVVDSLAPECSNKAFSFKLTDTFRKYLAGYLNFVTLGFVLAGSLGLLIMLLFFLLSRVKKLKESEKVGIYLKVLPAVLFSGLVVTTINTFVLLETVVNYQGRAFWLFYVPRFAEEIIISVIQAYVITLLITALSANKSLAKMLGITSQVGKA